MKKTFASQKADSLAYFFEIANQDSIAYEKRHEYTTKALALISKELNDSIKRLNYFKVANRYFNIHAMEDYKQATLLIINNSLEAKDTASLVKAYSYIIDYYVSKNISDGIYIYNYKLEKLYTILKDNHNIAKCLLNKAILQHNQSDYLGCERTVFRMLKILRVENDNKMRYEAYNILGIIYGELEEYKLSKEYYIKALDISKMKDIPVENQLKATTLNNLGILYGKQNKNVEALEVYNIALNQDNLFVNRPDIFAMIKDNMAYSEFKLGNHKHLPGLFFEALKIRDSLNIIPGIILNNTHLSEYYAFKKDTLTAIKYANDSYELAKKNNLKPDVLLSLEQLVEVDPKQATKYSKEHFRINDSLQLAERKIRNKFALIEYETEEIALEKGKLTQQKSVLIYIAVGILSLAVIIFIIRYQITKRKDMRYLRDQKNANEEIYQLMLDQQQKIEEGKQLEKKRISRELHDGVMGRLSSIRLNLFILNKKTDPETITKCMEQVGEIQNVEKEIKTIAYDLEKNVFSDTIGFVTIVKNLFRNIEEHSELHFKLELDETIEWELLHGNTKINIYRILQESLHNINKYADAKKVALTIRKTENGITLAVEDDGKGFDVQKIKKGLGLKNMEERTKEMNGKIDIRSGEGQGTKINLIIPL